MTTPNHQAELLPCPTPWCDAVFGPPVLKEEHFSAYIYCPTCGVESRRQPSTLEAIAFWNTRPASHEAELVEALEEISNLPGEINPSNYDHDDACELNRQFCYAASIATNALAKTKAGAA